MELIICPTYCDLKIMADNGFMYNIPACFPQHVIDSVLDVARKKAGLAIADKVPDGPLPRGRH